MKKNEKNKTKNKEKKQRLFLERPHLQKRCVGKRLISLHIP